MADYRQYCEGDDGCGREVGFGSHAPSCARMRKYHEAMRTLKKLEDDTHRLYHGFSDEHLLALAHSNCDRQELLEEAIHELNIKWKFISGEMRNRGDMHYKFNTERGYVRK